MSNFEAHFYKQTGTEKREQSPGGKEEEESNLLGSKLYKTAAKEQPRPRSTEDTAEGRLAQQFYKDAPGPKTEVSRALAETADPLYGVGQRLYGSSDDQGDGGASGDEEDEFEYVDDDDNAGKKGADTDTNGDLSSVEPPEGVELDDVERLAKDLGITSTSGQQRLAEVYSAELERQLDDHDAQGEEWAREARADPYLQHGFDSHIRRAKSVLREYGDTELGELLESSKLGDNKAVIKFLSRIGKDIRDLMDKL